jgi:hypothetical protein
MVGGCGADIQRKKKDEPESAWVDWASAYDNDDDVSSEESADSEDDDGSDPALTTELARYAERCAHADLEGSKEHFVATLRRVFNAQTALTRAQEALRCAERQHRAADENHDRAELAYAVAKQKLDDAERISPSGLPDYAKDFEIPVLLEDGSYGDWACRHVRYGY